MLAPSAIPWLPAESSSLDGQVYDPFDPMGKMFFNILATFTFAEFEVDLLRMRTREGMPRLTIYRGLQRPGASSG